jgi:GTPase SAR1 family protein
LAAKRPPIQKIGDIAYIHLALVGPSGSGKTGFMADAKRNLYLTTDPEGTFTAKALGSQADEIICKTAKDFDEAYVWLAEEGHKEYDVVTVDNISEAQKLYLYAAKEAAMRRGAKSDPLVPDPSEYLRAQLAIVKAVKGFHDLPMHVVWTAHQKGWEDEFGEPFYSMVLQGGKGEVAQTVLGYMNINLFIEKMEKDDKEIRRFWATYKGPYRGKDRTQSLGRFKDNLTWPQLLVLFEAAQKKITAEHAGKSSTTTVKKPARRRPAVAAK